MVIYYKVPINLGAESHFFTQYETYFRINP